MRWWWGLCAACLLWAPGFKAQSNVEFTSQNSTEGVEGLDCVYSCRGICFWPISFSFSLSRMVSTVGEKSQDFATVDPENKSSYIFPLTRAGEAEYHADYRRSYFGVTFQKHYEILANGAVPLFFGLPACPKGTLFAYPARLVERAFRLPGLGGSQRKIDHSKFDYQKYHEIASEMLAYTRNVLTHQVMARYVLEATGNTDAKKILYLQSPGEKGNFLMDHLAVSQPIHNRIHRGQYGFRQILGAGSVDVHYLDYQYQQPSPEAEQAWRDQLCDISHLVAHARCSYGSGFSYMGELDPAVNASIDRTDIDRRIRSKEFDLVVYGDPYRWDGFLLHLKGPPQFWEAVTETYPRNKVILLDGDDIYPIKHPYHPHMLDHQLASKAIVFLRESFISDCDVRSVDMSRALRTLRSAAVAMGAPDTLDMTAATGIQL